MEEKKKDNDEQKFILIVRGSIYAFMKEKYPDYDINVSGQINEKNNLDYNYFKRYAA